MSPRDKVNILLVDDQPAKLLSLHAILADLGENLIQATSADEALKHLLTEDVAIVLMDVCMPRMDGFELAELVREHPRFRRTAIIFISAVHLTDADRLRGYDLGAVDYIPVPIIPQVLRAKVAVFADLYRKTKQLEQLNAELKDRVAELDQSNERLRFADRMATIGTLAAGLGHDMGNLLLPVRLRLDTLETVDLPVDAREDVAAIRKGTEYLQRLASSLRLLALDSQGVAEGASETTLSEWWEETEGMIRNGVPRTVELVGSFAKNLPPARIDKAALTQIVFNLVQNAGDAMKGRDSGRVVVSAERSSKKNSIYLSVADNGPGMSADAKLRCLEPFFTTKTRGVSTGLGLALVAGLVKRAKGALEIASEPGQGATFKLEIPSAPHDGASADRAARRGVAVVAIKNQRLRAHVRSVLASLEYEVCAAERPDACVLVMEGADADVMESAEQFVASDPLFRAVLFDARPESPPRNNRLVCLDSALKPSAIRTCLLSLLSSEN